jgi:hypothetical protein
MRVAISAEEDLFIPNRDYMMLCCIYFNAVQRRLYYWTQLSANVVAIENGWFSARNTEQWFEHDVLQSLGEEGYEDIYGEARECSFEFVGDTEWFSYRYPERPKAKGPILDCIRPIEAAEYFKVVKLSKQLLIDTSKDHRNDMTGKCSRLFVLMAINQYFRNNYGISWRAAVVVENADIEASEIKLYKSPFPCLIKILGDYWVYNRGLLYPSDNIYQTFAMWLYLIHKKYNNWFGKINLEYLAKPLLRKRIAEEDRENRFILPQI